MKTVWITKYALTRGIYEAEVINHDSSSGRISIKDVSGLNGVSRFSKTEWMPSRESAMALAREMRDRRVKSLRTQIDRLSSLFNE